jgi:preprotein translocase subunit YajC
MNFWMLAAAAAAQGQGGAWGSLLMMGLIFVVFWFLMIMPQRKQQKQRNEMLSNLKKGDKVVTIGGIHGEIVEFDEDDLKLKINDKVEIKFTRSAIARVKS